MKAIIGGKLPAETAMATQLASGFARPAVTTRVVDEGSDGQRLDNFLLRELKGIPKTHVYRIIRSGEVRVNKGRAQADTRLSLGDVVRLPPLQMPATHDLVAPSTAPPREFPILFEDDALLVIDKPSGVAVHGGSGLSFGVIEQLRRARPQASFLELVHRLDRETSGVLMVAKRRRALTHLQEQLRNRSTGKTYLALVQGAWPASQRVIDIPLVKFHLPTGDGQSERRVRTTDDTDSEGQRAITLVRLRAAVGPFSLLEVTIKTGRTHQIRVHLASKGHPIAGDDKYGDYELNRQMQKGAPSFSPSRGFPPSVAARAHAAPKLGRMFLHAWRLEVNHPISGERLTLVSELPDALQQFVDVWKTDEPPL